MGSVILFPITIPLTPIYLGVKGNWEPTGVFMFAMILGFLLLVIGNKLYKLDLTNSGWLAPLIISSDYSFSLSSTFSIHFNISFLVVLISPGFFSP